MHSDGHEVGWQLGLEPHWLGAVLVPQIELVQSAGWFAVPSHTVGHVQYAFWAQ